MTTATFQTKVLTYTHLPESFLKELARVADALPEETQQAIVKELDDSAARELQILKDGYKVIADAEKSVRKEAETEERTVEMKHADNLFGNTSSLSV